MTQNTFVQFSKPFLDALTETFDMMLQTTATAHSPKIKKGNKARGEISAMIGMNGTVTKDGNTKDFKGILALSWPEELYIKLAGRMLNEEYTEYCDDIADSGAEICNIVMGNAKGGLSKFGYSIEMATPTTVRGVDHEIKYPEKTTVIEIEISCDLGTFALNLCYEED